MTRVARPHFVRTVITVITVLACACPLSALDVPYLSGRVNDLAGFLDDTTSSRLEGQLAQLERETGAQVALLTVPTLAGDGIEDFSIRVADTWQLGDAEIDNGVLFLVAQAERQMRIEVGYGLEPVLTDALSGRILDHAVRPLFRNGDFAGGLSEGVSAIDEAIRTGDVRSLTPATRPGTDMGERVITLLVWTLFALFAPGCVAYLLIAVSSPIVYMVASSVLGPVGGVFATAVWIIGLLVIRTVLGKLGGPGGGLPGGWSSTRNWGGGGFSGGGFSGGGFSGGGGSFGGGGASSSW